MGIETEFSHFRYDKYEFFIDEGHFFRRYSNKQPVEIQETDFLSNKTRCIKVLADMEARNLQSIQNLSYPQGKYCVLDLFAGAGGFSLGFHNAGFHILGALDFDRYACETHRYNFPNTVTIEGDITSMNPKELPFEKKRVDVVIGGPPCQGFSGIGQVKIRSLVKQGVWDPKLGKDPRFIDDPRNVLYKHFVRFIEFYKPKIFIMENVEGLFNYQEGRLRCQILEDFEKLGYRVDVQKLNAAEYGVPQKRIRVIFLGNRLQKKDCAQEKIPNTFPQKTHYIQEGHRINSEFQNSDLDLKPAIPLWDAISDLSFLEAGEGGEELEYPAQGNNFPDYQRFMREGSARIFNHYPRKLADQDRPIFDYLKPGQIYLDLPTELKRYGDGSKFADKMRRLPYDEPCRTIVAHLYKDGYMYIHPKSNRTITVREAARIQSFPDNFVFKGARTHQFKQVGNAVPPLLGNAIALCVKQMLDLHKTNNPEFFQKT